MIMVTDTRHWSDKGCHKKCDTAEQKYPTNKQSSEVEPIFIWDRDENTNASEYESHNHK